MVRNGQPHKNWSYKYKPAPRLCLGPVELPFIKTGKLHLFHLLFLFGTERLMTAATGFADGFHGLADAFA